MSLENKYSICKGLCVCVCVCVCVEKNSGTIVFTFLICVSLGKEATNANSTLCVVPTVYNGNIYHFIVNISF